MPRSGCASVAPVALLGNHRPACRRPRADCTRVGARRRESAQRLGSPASMLPAAWPTGPGITSHAGSLRGATRTCASRWATRQPRPMRRSTPRTADSSGKTPQRPGGGRASRWRIPRGRRRGRHRPGRIFLRRHAIRGADPRAAARAFIELAHRFRDLPTRPMRAWRLRPGLGRHPRRKRPGGVRWGLRAMLLGRPLHDVASMTIGFRSRGLCCSSLATLRAPLPSSQLFSRSAIGMAFVLPSPSNGFWESIPPTSESLAAGTGLRGRGRAPRGRGMTIDEIFAYLVERLDALGIEPAEVVRP